MTAETVLALFLVALLVRTPDGDITSTDHLPLDTPVEVLP